MCIADDKAVLGVDGNSWMYNVTSAESVHRDIAFRVVDVSFEPFKIQTCKVKVGV